MGKAFRVSLFFVGTGTTGEYSPAQPLYFPNPVVVEAVMMQVSSDTSVPVEVGVRHGVDFFPFAVFSSLKLLTPVAVYPRVTLDEDDALSMKVLGNASGIGFTAYLSGHYDDPPQKYETPVMMGY